jgi:sugar/nucleoside kinase (ribokinase family)
MAKYHIYGIGAALVDKVVAVSDEFLEQHAIEKGTVTLIGDARQAELLKALEQSNHILMKQSGGSASNTVIAAANFGSKTFFSGKVADDNAGAHFACDLAHAGVTFQSASPEAGVTGKSLVMVSDDGVRTRNTNLGASEQITSREIDEVALLESEWLYIEGGCLASDSRFDLIKDVVSKAKEAGVNVALGFTGPTIDQAFSKNIWTMIDGGVDLILCSRDEAVSFTQAFSLTEACDVLERNVKMYAVTGGPQGTVIFDGQETFNVPQISVDDVDENGTVDMFAGAFLYAITAGYELKWAAELANESAARVLEQYGPRLDAVEFESIMQKFEI